MILFENILRLTEKELFGYLEEKYKDNAITKYNNFILVKGEAPIMLVAHLDTVHKEPVRDICRSSDRNIIMSPQGIGGDDRCGVYALEKIYELSKQKPYLLFTCGEETGGIGAYYFSNLYESGYLQKKYKELKDIKLIIEIDRAHFNDAVYYDCDNKELEEYITSKGFETHDGIFSDISIIAPVMKIAAVNLSCGYYNPHTLHEYINLEELKITISKVLSIVKNVSKKDFIQYKYFSIEDSFYRDKNSRAIFPDYDFDFYHDIFQEEEYNKVSEEYRYYYDSLLDTYSADELDEYRQIFGDQVLKEIYDEEMLDSAI